MVGKESVQINNYEKDLLSFRRAVKLELSVKMVVTVCFAVLWYVFCLDVASRENSC